MAGPRPLVLRPGAIRRGRWRCGGKSTHCAATKSRPRCTTTTGRMQRSLRLTGRRPSGPAVPSRFWVKAATDRSGSHYSGDSAVAAVELPALAQAARRPAGGRRASRPDRSQGARRDRPRRSRRTVPVDRPSMSTTRRVPAPTNWHWLPRIRAHRRQSGSRRRREREVRTATGVQCAPRTR